MPDRCDVHVLGDKCIPFTATSGGDALADLGGGDFGNPSERSIEGVWALRLRENEI